jgi:PHS family inorganic phosphate transporter-like MFS transporter
MAAIFLMQPLGQLAATLVGLIVVHTYGSDRGLREQSDQARAATITDSMWRVIVGVGGIPLLLALPFRLTIPEPFRYVLGDLKTSRPKPRRVRIPDVTNRYYEDLPSYSKEPHPGETVQFETISGGLFETASGGLRALESDSRGPSRSSAEAAQAFANHYRSQRHPGNIEPLSQYHPDDEEEEEEEAPEPELESAEPHFSFSTDKISPFSKDDIYKYFWLEGNWRFLVGISVCGFLLHTAFAVLGTYDYRVIFQIWDYANPPNNSTTSNSTSLPVYSNGQSVSLVPGAEIYNVLSNSATNSLIIVSLPSVVGSVLALMMVDYIARKHSLVSTSLAFAALLVTAGTFIAVGSTRPVVITLYVLLHFVFNFGE